LFGTFNPPHIGHTLIANYFYITNNFDEIWFMVSPQNPFKKDISNEIYPQIVEFSPQVTSEIGITMLANSITLTPGTVTIVAKRINLLYMPLHQSLLKGFTKASLKRK